MEDVVTAIVANSAKLIVTTESRRAIRRAAPRATDPPTACLRHNPRFGSGISHELYIPLVRR